MTMLVCEILVLRKLNDGALKHRVWDKKAILAYKISDEVILKEYSNESR